MHTTNISEIKQLVLPDVLSCPDPIVQREVLTVILDFCKKTNILQREFELEVDSDDIDEDIQDCIDFDISAYAHDLRPVSILSMIIDTAVYIPFKRNIRNTITNFGATETPVGSYSSDDTRFKNYWVPNSHTIRVFNMDAGMTNIYFNMSAKPLRSATTIDSALFEDWSEALVSGAKYRILAMPGKDWSDAQAAIDYKRDYRKYLSQAKREAMTGGTDISQEQIKWKSFGG
jgi:hypothetical protein